MMEFEKLKTEVVAHEKFWEEISFVVPKSTYFCPSCDTRRRKLINVFEYISHRHEKGFKLSFEKPICENCFIFDVHSQSVMDFYESLK